MIWHGYGTSLSLCRNHWNHLLLEFNMRKFWHVHCHVNPVWLPNGERGVKPSQLCIFLSPGTFGGFLSHGEYPQIIQVSFFYGFGGSPCIPHFQKTTKSLGLQDRPATDFQSLRWHWPLLVLSAARPPVPVLGVAGFQAAPASDTWGTAGLINPGGRLRNRLKSMRPTKAHQKDMVINYVNICKPIR